MICDRQVPKTNLHSRNVAPIIWKLTHHTVVRLHIVAITFRHSRVVAPIIWNLHITVRLHITSSPSSHRRHLISSGGTALCGRPLLPPLPSQVRSYALVRLTCSNGERRLRATRLFWNLHVWSYYHVSSRPPTRRFAPGGRPLLPTNSLPS